MRKITIAISIIVLINACAPKSENKTDAVRNDSSNVIKLTPGQHKAANITLQSLETRPMGTSLKVNGMLDVPPQNLITISAPMGGFVKSTKLLQGMKVKQGEVIATLENQEYIQLQQEYLDSKSKLEFLDAEYNRQTELARENVNAQKALQQAKSQFQSMKAMVRSLDAKLGMINIDASTLSEATITPGVKLYSPIAGYVTVVNVNIGQYVNATDVMFKIVNIEHIHAELQVFEKDISKVKVGQKVNFQLAHESELRTASVYLIGKEISAERTVRIHCHLDKEDEHLLPGMYITASIETTSHNAEVLPSSSIINFEGKDYVFATTKVKDEFEMINVHAGQTAGGYTEVELPSGFDKTRSFVSAGVFELLGVLRNVEEEE
ncbi:MAG TPA: efflux RND transporter periplasmic adaptor subunit [Chryseolinea sp.]|nr:efflux RND transporter periplasmic adaptor subunit [Chryseolinea sp.]